MINDTNINGNMNQATTITTVYEEPRQAEYLEETIENLTEDRPLKWTRTLTTSNAHEGLSPGELVQNTRVTTVYDEGDVMESAQRNMTTINEGQEVKNFEERFGKNNPGVTADKQVNSIDASSQRTNIFQREPKSPRGIQRSFTLPCSPPMSPGTMSPGIMSPGAMSPLPMSPSSPTFGFFDQKSLFEPESGVDDLIDEDFKPNPFSPRSSFSSKRPTLSRAQTWASQSLAECLAESDAKAKVELHPLQTQTGMIVSVQPPEKPLNLNRHAVDLVLAIDVSQSMAVAARLPDSSQDTGLSILDLVKHAIRSIIETMDEDDRLGLVAFGNEAHVLQPLAPMDEANKESILSKLEELEPSGQTNLWAGLRTAYTLFDRASASGNAAALYLMSDGEPKQRGQPETDYISKLKPMLKRTHAQLKAPRSIHTFGFGYKIRSDVLQSIAEVGGGNYAFISDAGMLGTVLVHAVANFYSTFATGAKLTLRTTGGLELKIPKGAIVSHKSDNELVLSLNNVQFGQSRDVFFEYESGTVTDDAGVSATLVYTAPGDVCHVASAKTQVSEVSSLESDLVNYHVSRAKVCEFLSSLSAPKDTGFAAQHEALQNAQAELKQLVKILKDGQPDDKLDDGLLEDLDGEDPKGQIRTALAGDLNFRTWGVHYLPSLLHAHRNQISTSFKDGRYGKNSPMFRKYLEELNSCFNSLPGPKPSRPNLGRTRSDSLMSAADKTTAQTPMADFNRVDNPCFAGSCRVQIANGTTIPVRKLRPGMAVWTPVGPRKVVAVVKTRARDVTMCQIGDLWITPYHPIYHEHSWVFPMTVADSVAMQSTNIYSVLLAQHGAPHAHAIEVGGVTCVTLGHGLMQKGAQGVRGHPYLGNWQAVFKDLAKLPKERSGKLRAGGIRRDPATGLAAGFVPPGGRLENRPSWLRLSPTLLKRQMSVRSVRGYLAPVSDSVWGLR
ncbi:hint-domain-containing protein [Phyllosticta citribraziliensis]|uniref:Hint-domain-containing protein n=1 Tax=Phyllosticta citribraziliensis TaxID=989973 RepID=A0ABR1MAF2_9PEZI